ncbi:unnamed protein product [Rotaria magnacalcarata]|uniref:Uncharacterized protein n=1 Tax=Rotaria magnacalcarata TaxID=392030 RepID=A0A816U315_9BILA|nr:unnamed protein product [Rotaria magnacalcarata]CAF2240320.1 unnamed protein product [Rotaria magnacalcarata]CAF3976516.1 unnamed protein product [Rotaria magnacalcarata]CAF4017682.1 unnamed protein product [Rotaria magnacalcarata]
MYASNEDEFNSQDGDWIFLKETPPETTTLDGAVNLIDFVQSSSSSSGSSSSSSSKSDRSGSLSSLSSIEHERMQNDNHIEEQEQHLLIEDPVLNSQYDDNTYNDDHDLSLTGEIKEEISSSETLTMHSDESETTPVINEYDFFNGGYDLSHDAALVPNNLQQSTSAYVQQTAIAEQQASLISENQLVPLTMHYYRPRRNNVFVVYGFFILVFVLQLILVRVISSQRLMINKLHEELDETNRRLDEIQIVSIEDIEQKLTKQFDEKLQTLIKQKTIEYNHEKYGMVLQIKELQHIINFTRYNLTNTIDQLSDKNERLQKKLITLEHRMQINEKDSSTENESCSEGDSCTKSSVSSLDVLLSNFIKQTSAIAENTSTNLSDFFQTLSSSLSDLVDQRHEFVEQSKQKLSDFSRSPAAEQIQMSLRRGMEHFSSSLRKAQTTYAAWLGSRAQQREEARMSNDEQEQKTERRPWRWTFQRGYDRERMRHQTPTTKSHSSNTKYVCHSRYSIPMANCFQ